MRTWKSFKHNEFSCEDSEDILWLIFDKAFSGKVSNFVKLMKQASEGYGYSAVDYLGYSLVNDYDEGDYPVGIIEIECGTERFELDFNRFKELLKLACDYYVQRIGTSQSAAIDSMFVQFCLICDPHISKQKDPF